MWFSYFDMHSGGGLKTAYEVIFIEADSQVRADCTFMDTLGRDPNNATCAVCCGADYSKDVGRTLLESARYYRKDMGRDKFREKALVLFDGRPCNTYNYAEPD